MKDEYPSVKQDLYGAFVVRGIELTNDAGLLAVVIGDTWMSITSFEALRQSLLGGHSFGSFVHMRDVSNHPDVFGANAAFVLSMAGNRKRHAPFIRLTALGSECKEHDLLAAIAERTQMAGYHLASSEDFAAIPGSPIVYWLSEKMRAAFTRSRPLIEIAKPRQGLLTGNSEAYVREWWEVSGDRTSMRCATRESAAETASRWFPYNKGGEFRRWHGNHEHVVNWQDDGAEVRSFGTEAGGRARSRPQNVDYYFCPSVSWTNVSSGDPAFRAYPAGFISAGSTGDGLFPSFDQDALSFLGFLNSSTSTAFLKAIAPGLTFNVGEISVLPIIDSVLADKSFTTRVEQLVAASEDDWDSVETSWNFERSPLVALF